MAARDRTRFKRVKLCHEHGRVHMRVVILTCDLTRSKVPLYDEIHCELIVLRVPPAARELPRHNGTRLRRHNERAHRCSAPSWRHTRDRQHAIRADRAHGRAVVADHSRARRGRCHVRRYEIVGNYNVGSQRAHHHTVCTYDQNHANFMSIAWKFTTENRQNFFRRSELIFQ